jgi:hypothetical protein
VGAALCCARSAGAARCTRRLSAAFCRPPRAPLAAAWCFGGCACHRVAEAAIAASFPSFRGLLFAVGASDPSVSAPSPGRLDCGASQPAGTAAPGLPRRDEAGPTLWRFVCIARRRLSGILGPRLGNGCLASRQGGPVGGRPAGGRRSLYALVRPSRPSGGAAGARPLPRLQGCDAARWRPCRDWEGLAQRRRCRVGDRTTSPIGDHGSCCSALNARHVADVWSP